jgi:hypothetical protein
MTTKSIWAKLIEQKILGNIIKNFIITSSYLKREERQLKITGNGLDFASFHHSSLI